MLWVKAVHIIFMISWFAGLFYLPRLFVYHAMSIDEEGLDTTSNARFKIMERKLLNGIMLPAAVLMAISGVWMLYDYALQTYAHASWLHIKLLLVLPLLFYHYICYRYYTQFRDDKNTKTHVFFRWFNEFPVLILIAVILLITLKPF